MNDLELNREYTYKQICKVLGWKYYTGGNSKDAQIREIEAAFEFYHPMNKKTHNPKCSYIFTQQLGELNKPKQGGVRNTKAIQPMMDYLTVKGKIEFENIVDYKYSSFTTWFCDRLNIFKKDVYNIPYSGEKAIQSFCEGHNISNARLFCDYISTAKSITKNMFRKALYAMEKQDILEVEEGYMFTYKLGKRSKGHFETILFNDIIKQVETDVCNEMKTEHSLSEKLSGRQLLLVIYGKKELKEEFDKKKLDALMKNHLDLLNQCVDEIDTDIGSYCGRTYIDEEHPLLSYYPGLVILGMIRLDDEDEVEWYDADYELKIANVIRARTKDMVLNSKWKDKYGHIHNNYDYITGSADVKKIEKLLYVHVDEADTAAGQDSQSEMFEFDEDEFGFDDEELAAFEKIDWQNSVAKQDSQEPEAVGVDVGEDEFGFDDEAEVDDDEFLSQLSADDENEDDWRSLIEKLRGYSA